MMYSIPAVEELYQELERLDDAAPTLTLTPDAFPEEATTSSRSTRPASHQQRWVELTPRPPAAALSTNAGTPRAKKCSSTGSGSRRRVPPPSLSAAERVGLGGWSEELELAVGDADGGSATLSSSSRSCGDARTDSRTSLATSLPIDCLCIAFSHLPLKDLLCGAELTCQRWAAAVQMEPSWTGLLLFYRMSNESASRPQYYRQQEQPLLFLPSTSTGTGSQTDSGVEVGNPPPVFSPPATGRARTLVRGEVLSQRKELDEELDHLQGRYAAVSERLLDHTVQLFTTESGTLTSSRDTSQGGRGGRGGVERMFLFGAEEVQFLFSELDRTDRMIESSRAALKEAHSHTYDLQRAEKESSEMIRSTIAPTQAECARDWSSTVMGPSPAELGSCFERKTILALLSVSCGREVVSAAGSNLRLNSFGDLELWLSLGSDSNGSGNGAGPPSSPIVIETDDRLALHREWKTVKYVCRSILTQLTALSIPSIFPSTATSPPLSNCKVVEELLSLECPFEYMQRLQSLSPPQ